MRDVGIVMPVYKQDPIYLELALRSILEQSYKHFYFVIVSDGAPRETNDVIYKVTKEDPRAHFILKEKNQGVAKALNTGFDYLMKIGEVNYLTWVSSDNIYYDSYLEKLRNALDAAPDNVGLSYSSFRHIDARGEFLKEPQLEEFYKYQDQPKENLLDVCFIGVSFMYKKQYAAMIDGYKMEPVEDYEYWLRLTEHCDIVYIPEALMEYRTNSPLSVSAQLRNSKAQHRRWRYAFNLARLEARNRRKIPFKLTIIYPVQDGSEKTIAKLEELLEQSYSNYKLIIIDRSLDQSASKIFHTIEDPRVYIMKFPGITEKEAISRGMNAADTPLTLIYGKGSFPSSTVALYDLVIKSNEIRDESVAFTDKGIRNVGHRTTFIGEEPSFGELYFTKTLNKNLMESNQNKSFLLPRILVNSVPKSGTHLLLQIILGIPGIRRTDFWVFQDQDLKNIEPGYVATGHFEFSPERASKINESNVKTLFICRDLRDIVVSLVHFVMLNQYNHPWNPYMNKHLKNHDERLMAMIKGVKLSKEENLRYGIGELPNIYTISKNFIGWAQAPNICFVTFEDLVRNEHSQNKAILKIINFLWNDLKDMGLTKEQLLQKMKQNINHQTSDTFRKGAIGDWKQEFNEMHKAAFKEVAGDLLIKLKYEKDNNW